LDIFSRSGDIRNQYLFGGALPEFLDLDYKVEPDSDHVAVSWRSAEGPRRLGVEQKKTRAEHKPVRNGGSGRPNDGLQYPLPDVINAQTKYAANPLSLHHFMTRHGFITTTM